MLTSFGSEKSFEKATELVKEHYGVDIGGSTLRRSTIKHADRMLEKQKTQAKVRKLKSKGKDEIIAEMDGSYVPMVKIKEGEGDKRKRRGTYFEEVKLGAAQGKGEVKVYYGATFGDVDEAGEIWAKIVQKVGWSSESKIHSVGDGAVWIADQSKKQFGKKGRYLLDFFHVSEYLGAVAKENFEEKEVKQWLKKQQELLKENRWAEVLENIKVYIKDAKEEKEVKGVEEEKDAKEVCAAQKAYRYLSNRQGQLDYKGAIEKKLPIGSGLIESGHKHVLQSRLKIAGGYWLKENAEGMTELLVVKKNGEWEDYWQQSSIKLAA